MLIPCVPIQSSCNFGAATRDGTLSAERTLTKDWTPSKNTNPGLDTIHKKNNKEINQGFGHFPQKNINFGWYIIHHQEKFGIVN